MLDFNWFADPNAWAALVTLTLLEIVLGIDNIVFLAILVDRLPPERRKAGRIFGLGLAMITRLMLLGTIKWIMGLKAVLFSIPVAIVGALFALALTSKSISIYSMLGIIMLVGLVAKNAILLVDRANQMKDEKGFTSYDALLEAGQTRLRPILMTTMAMVIGMMPIALSTSAGSEAKSGLAVVLIGGLLSSMLLTLVVVPVVFARVDKMKARVQAYFAK